MSQAGGRKKCDLTEVLAHYGGIQHCIMTVVKLLCVFVCELQPNEGGVTSYTHPQAKSQVQLSETYQDHEPSSTGKTLSVKQ